MRGLLIIAACILVFGSFALAENGMVIGITGKWTTRGKELRFGSVLGRNAILRCEPGSSLVVGVTETNPPVRLECRCDEEKVVKLRKAQAQPEPDAMFQRLADAAEPYSTRRPDRLTAAIGRDLREAVVPLTDGVVDLGPAFRNAAPGVYQVRLAPVAVTSAAAPIEVVWTPGKPLHVPNAGFRPGLNRLTLTDEFGPGVEAWVLFSPPQEYANAARQFQSAIEEAASWDGGRDYGLYSPVLRAFLEALAEQRSDLTNLRGPSSSR